MPPTYTFTQNHARDGSADVVGGRQLTSEWECVTDTISGVNADTVIDALFVALGVAYNVAHPTYPAAKVTNLSAVVDSRAPYRWTVKATYFEPRPQPGTDPQAPPDPPDRDPWVRGSFRREDVFRGVDNTSAIEIPDPDDPNPDPAGVPNGRRPRKFMNSAGDLLDNPPPIPLSVGTLVITKYFTAIDYFTLKAYENCCNTAAFYDFPPHSLCVIGVEWAPHTERSWFGYKVVFNLEHRAVTPEQLSIKTENPENILGAGADNMPWSGSLTDLSTLTIPNAAKTPTGGFHPVAVLDIGWSYQEFIGNVDGVPTYKKVPFDEPAGSGVPKPVPGFLNGINGQRHTTPRHVGFDTFPRISFAIMQA